MDQIGLIITHVDEKGLLRLQRGRINAKELLGLICFDNGLEGVIVKKN